ncbi:hypothetical protein GCM10027073_43760 [Streptomyces chlorus]
MNPDTSVPAARRLTGPTPRADNAENPEDAANTDFPSERDPLTWGTGPTSRITGPENPGSHARHPKYAANRARR